MNQYVTFDAVNTFTNRTYHCVRLFFTSCHQNRLATSASGVGIDSE